MKRDDALCDGCMKPDRDGLCEECAMRTVTSIKIGTQGVYHLELSESGHDYKAVVVMNCGGVATLNSLMRVGGQREMRHGQTRSRLREVVTSLAQKRYRVKMGIA